MSRLDSEISPASWRVAITGLYLVTGAAIAVALLIGAQSRARDTSLIRNRLDERWAIQAGRVEADRLVLRPAAGAIGLALHPIDSAAFTLQTRVVFNPPQGAAGLIVRAADADHFSAFLISGDGYFRVGDYSNGEWIDRVAWRAWPHIRRDGMANVLRAECRADACTFFVNDEWTWQEHVQPAAHSFGFIADAQSTGEMLEARFDQIGWQP